MFHLIPKLIAFSFLAASDPRPVPDESRDGVHQDYEAAIHRYQVPKDLDEAALAGYDLTNPALRMAYAYLVMCRFTLDGRLVSSDPRLHAILNDLKRRNDSATPLLLDLMEHNRNTALEGLAPYTLTSIGGFKMEPYLEYLRTAIRTRPHEMSDAMAGRMAAVFARSGTPEDIRLVQGLARARPYLAFSIDRTLNAELADNALRAVPAGVTPNAALLPQSTPPPTARLWTSPSPTTPIAQIPAQSIKQGAPVWPWVVGILALIAIIAAALKRRA